MFLNYLRKINHFLLKSNNIVKNKQRNQFHCGEKREAAAMGVTLKHNSRVYLNDEIRVMNIKNSFFPLEQNFPKKKSKHIDLKKCIDSKIYIHFTKAKELTLQFCV